MDKKYIISLSESTNDEKSINNEESIIPSLLNCIDTQESTS